MLGWIARGLRQGRITTRYPRSPEPAPAGYRGHVEVVDPGGAAPELAGLCPTGAITVDGSGRVTLDRGRCILCGECGRVAPDRFRFVSEYQTAERTRSALVVGDHLGTLPLPTHETLRELAPALGRSIHVRHIDCGSDGSEEWEIQALWNPYYDIQRLGFFLTPAPRHADVLLVTGGVTAAMREPLQRTWEVMPAPKALVAVGTDACSGGLAGADQLVAGGVDRVLPVDVYVPGSPPAPIAILHGLLLAVGLLGPWGGGGMTPVFAVAMGALAVAPLLTIRFTRPAALCSALGCVLLVIVGVDAALGGARPVLELGGWIGFGPSPLRADGLAGIFLALTGLTGGAVSLAYTGSPAGRGLTCLASVLLLTVAVVIGSGNAFLFLLAWEGLTVCVYLITSTSRPREELLSGYLTGGLAKIGGAALLAAIGLMYAHTHSFSLQAWTHAAMPAGTKGVVCLLFLACFATKIGVLPLQGGLPTGYGAAPRLGAASLSVALCAGFYGLWRFEFQVLGPLPVWCGDVFLILGGVTALTGITYALTQDSLRRFLGYSTVEHAGIVLVGLGVALLGQSAHKPILAAVGLLAATLHVIAHNLAKTLALITIDRVEQATGQRTLDPLGGLSRRLPASVLALGISSLTLAAIPPLGGFVSEWFTFEALLQGFRMPTLLSRLLCALAAAALALTAGLGLLAFAKFYSAIFLGQARTKLAGVREPTRWPAGLLGLGVIVLFLGTVAPWEIHALGSGLQALLGLNPALTTISHPLVLTPVFKGFSVLAPTWLSIDLPAYVVLALIVVRLMRGRSVRARPVRRAPVWVTGSGADLAAVQYRPSAYSNPMRVILRGPLGYRSRVLEDAAGARLDTRVVLAIDRFVYLPAAILALRAAALVRQIQSGRLSVYLLYMLVALILALSLVPILR